MTENKFHHKLDELSQQLSRLQQLTSDEPRQVRVLLPEVLAGLQRSLEELRRLGAECVEPAQSGSHESPQGERTLADEGRHVGGLRFNTRAEQSPVLIRIMDCDARCRWVSPAWLEFTGRSPAQMLGEGWLQDVHPEDRESCARIWHEAADPSRLDRVEYRLQRKDGGYGWLLEVRIPRLTSRGSHTGYLGTALEITEHKQAAASLTLQFAVARVLAQADTLEHAAGPILQLLCQSLDWDVGRLWSDGPTGRELHLVRLWARPSFDASGLRQGARAQVLPSGPYPEEQRQVPIWIADIASDQALARELQVQGVVLHGMCCLPVSVHGEIRAVVQLLCRTVRQKDDAALTCLTSVGVLIGRFLERLGRVERHRDAAARLAAIIEGALDALITIDRQGVVVEFNSAATELFGYSREQALGHELLELIVPARMRAEILADVDHYRTSGESPWIGKRFDAIAMKADGSEFPAEVGLALVGTGSQTLLVISMSDASVRLKSEREVGLYQERLRALMTDLLLVEERERRRLAIDLHDGLSQTIALAKIKLMALRPGMDQHLAGSLDEIEDLIDQADWSARSITFELSPPVLHDLGLEPAVQWLVENIQTRYGIEIVLEDDGQPKPADENTRVILFRSIRELLINAAKHARARRIHVCLERVADHLTAVVLDDGIGMEPSDAAIKGSGLLSIRERMTSVGGSMRIDSTP